MALDGHLSSRLLFLIKAVFASSQTLSDFHQILASCWYKRFTPHFKKSGIYDQPILRFFTPKLVIFFWLSIARNLGPISTIKDKHNFFQEIMILMDVLRIYDNHMNMWNGNLWEKNAFKLRSKFDEASSTNSNHSRNKSFTSFIMKFCMLIYTCIFHNTLNFFEFSPFFFINYLGLKLSYHFLAFLKHNETISSNMA